MKTATEAFKASLLDPNPLWARAVYYKRRYWQESTRTYVWESNWTLLGEDEVASISPISWQLDSDRLNEFRTSSVNIMLNNLEKQWKPYNRAGNFGPDSTATKGYEPFWTKFQVRISLTLADASTETITLYTGVAVNYIEDSDSGTINVELSGPEALMQRADAERVSTTVTEENLGTGNGSTTAFTTDNNGVGIISEVSINGIKKRAGVDYSITNLNDPDLPATITFTVAPTGGSTLRVSYIYWQTDQTFEDLVADLCEEAGITSGNRNISPVIFASSVVNTRTFQTNAEWNTGTLTNTDATTLANAIQHKYANAQTYHQASTGWTFANNSQYNSANTSFIGDGMQFSSWAANGSGGTQIHAVRAGTSIIGDWVISYTEGTSSLDTSTQFNIALFVSAYDATVPGDSTWQSGYVLRISAASSSTQVQITLGTVNASGLFSPLNWVFPVTRGAGTTHTIRVRRRSTGAWLVYQDDVLLFTVTDSTYSTATYFGYSTRFFNTGTLVLGYNGLQTPVGSSTGTWVSPIIDFGATPTQWGSFLYSETLGGGSTTYETRTSADGISFDSYVTVSGAVIGSTKRRYAQIRLTIDITSGDPYVSLISVAALTASTVVSLANFTGLTCYDAVASLAQFADYEFGFKSDETFFFRSKDTLTQPQAEFDKRILTSVPSVLHGYDRTYSKIRATYGTFSVDATSDGLYRLSGLARVSRSRLDLDGGSILIDDDADVATGVANAYLARYSKPRRRPKLNAKLLPHLELSDVVQVSFSDNLPQGWTIGDTSVELGDTSLQLYGKETQILHEFVGKVIGLRFDTDNWQTEFDLEEILNV